MSEKIEGMLETIVKKVLRVDEARDDMSMKSVPTWDSLKHIELISEIEEAFQINVEIEDVMHMTDVKGIRNVLKKYTGRGSAFREYQKIGTDFHFEFDSVFSLFSTRCKQQPHNEFLISLYKADEDRYTYQTLYEKVLRLREYLESQNIKRGDVINIIIQNSAEFLIVYFGALSLGAVVSPINYNFAAREMLFVIKDSLGKMLFADEEVLDKIEQVRSQIDRDYRIIQFSKNDSKYPYPIFDDIIKDGQPKPIESSAPNDVHLHDRAVIIYTSGTSGNPKGAILTHANLLSDAQAIAEWFRFDANTRALCILPLFHNNGQVVTLLAPLWSGGSTIMIKGNVSLMLFWELAEKYRATWSSVIPTILSVLLNYKISQKGNSLRGIICGGALLPRSVQLEFEKRFNVPIYEGYGLTETTSFSCFNPLELSKRKIGSIGLPLRVNEMAIFDPDGKELPPNEIGEICVRGPNVFLEYLNLPERNAAVFRDHWFHSGDYGFKDEEGYYYFEGRKDDMIIKGGENIYPREIENLIYMIPSVKECAVVGVSHAIWGEDLVLFVETAPGEKIERADLLEFLKERIAFYKIPSEIFFIDELSGLSEMPKGPTKKILRKELKKYYESSLRK